MALDKPPVPERPTNLVTVGQGPIALTVGAGGGCWTLFFSRLSFLFCFFLSGRWSDIDWNTVLFQRAVKSKQPTNQNRSKYMTV